MFLTRIGFGSKVVVTGDITQVDVPNGKSGLAGLEPLLTGIDGLPSSSSAGADVVRHRIVADIVAAYERDAGRRRRAAARRDRAVSEPPSPTVGADATAVVVGADEQFDVVVDVDRWCRWPTAVLATEGARGELTLTFVDRDEIAALNAEHLGHDGPDRRAVVPARRRATRCRACRCCSATSSCARRSPPSRRRRTPARSTTSWRCWSSTACCTCSATTTPSRPRRPRMRARELELLEAAPLARAGAGRVPSGAAERAIVSERTRHRARRLADRRDRASCCSCWLPAVAETASLNRISQVKAQAIAEPGDEVGRGVAAPGQPSGAVHQPAAGHGHRAADGPGVPHHAARRPPVRRQGRCRRLRPQRRRVLRASPRRCPRRGRCSRPERAALLTARPHRLAGVVPAAAPRSAAA